MQRLLAVTLAVGGQSETAYEIKRLILLAEYIWLQRPRCAVACFYLLCTITIPSVTLAAGSPSETALEIKRLISLAEDLAVGDAAAAAVQPVESADPDGSVLKKLQLWRQLRKGAIAQEIQRLQKLDW